MGRINFSTNIKPLLGFGQWLSNEDTENLSIFNLAKFDDPGIFVHFG
jgi:hypothetical protein